MPSSIWKGGVLLVLMTSMSLMRTSTSPVSRRGLYMSSGRARTTPVTEMGHSGRMVSATEKVSAPESSGSKVHWVRPSRSRRSTKIEAAVVAAVLDPAVQGHSLPHVGAAQLTAGVGVGGVLVQDARHSRWFSFAWSVLPRAVAGSFLQTACACVNGAARRQKSRPTGRLGCNDSAWGVTGRLRAAHAHETHGERLESPQSAGPKKTSDPLLTHHNMTAPS